jgi:hypothetical protein
LTKRENKKWLLSKANLERARTSAISDDPDEMLATKPGAAFRPGLLHPQNKKPISGNPGSARSSSISIFQID